MDDLVEECEVLPPARGHLRSIVRADGAEGNGGHQDKEQGLVESSTHSEMFDELS